jgi:SulP family sulfate permease
MFVSSGHNIALWTIPLGLAICLRIITHYSSNQYIFPTYFLSIPVVFYIVVAIGGWDFDRLRGAGWIFDVGRSTQPWYKFYTLFGE